MAQKQPGFITGANAKIKMFDKTVAYCSDVAYNITVQTIPVESMGTYEVHANEPVGYTVDGSFSVIRYTKHATESKIGGDSKPAADGNAPHRLAGSGTMGEHLNPALLLASQTFDLEIMEKTDESTDVGVFKVQDCRLTRRGATLNKRGVLVDNYAYVGILATDTDIDTGDQTGNSGVGSDLS